MIRPRIPQTAEEWVDFLLDLGWQPTEAIDGKVVVATTEGSIHFTPDFLRRLHLLDEEYADTNVDPTELFGEVFSALLEGDSIETMLLALRQFDRETAQYRKPPINDRAGYEIIGAKEPPSSSA